MYQLTNPLYCKSSIDDIKAEKFANEIALQINRDFPGQAIVENGCCFVTDQYWNKCKREVLKHSKIVLLEFENRTPRRPRYFYEAQYVSK